MKIKELNGKIILDSRNEKTIEVSIKTDYGLFSASSPSGKSKGRNEKPDFIGSIEEDIKKIIDFSDNLSQIRIEEFFDLEELEKQIRGKIGANSLFALESAILKALAFEQNRQLWQIVNEKAKKLPFPVGNCIGGGLHSKLIDFTKPDFQEFLIIPKANNFADNVFLMKKMHENLGKILKRKKVLGSLNDENAWSTSLSNEEVLELMNGQRKNLELETDKKIEIGIDIASSTFYTGLFYNYKNLQKKLNKEEQINYISELAKKFDIFYIEDPLNEEDFSGFKELREKTLGNSLIVGDDLIASSLDRFIKALKNKSINAIIAKPNQIGSLIEIKKLVDSAKKYGIITIMSHRSGETLDYSLADFSFALQTDFIKTGITGKEREIKLKRMIDIEKSFD